MSQLLFLFPNSTAHIQITLAVILLRVVGDPLSRKKLEFDSCIEWNGWSIQPALMIARLPVCKLRKITLLIDTLLQQPCRKNLEKNIGIMLWATSLVHHTRFLLTSLYKDLFAVLATKYSIQPTQWEYFLSIYSMMMLPSLFATVSISRWVHVSSSSNIQILLPSFNCQLTFLLSVTPGSESATLTQTNGNFPKNPNKLCNGSQPHCCLFFP